MPKIAAAILDTYPNKKMAQLAMNMVSRLSQIEKLYLFSDVPFYENALFNEIPPITTNNDYGNILINLLPEVISEEYILIFQWDGFPLVPNNWSDEFLKFDYIGAPIRWDLTKDIGWIGNGGFSLRSRKLFQAMKSLGISINPNDSIDQPEDELICIKHRKDLESLGIQFATWEIADKFSFQTGQVRNDIFGFHGSDNFPFFFPEQELLNSIDDIIPRMGQPFAVISFLMNCLKTNKVTLFRKILESYESKPNVLKAINLENQNNPQGGFLELVKNIAGHQ